MKNSANYANFAYLKGLILNFRISFFKNFRINRFKSEFLFKFIIKIWEASCENRLFLMLFLAVTIFCLNAQQNPPSLTVEPLTQN